MPLLISPLSSEHLAQFERDGGLVLRGYFTAHEISHALDAIETLVARPPRAGHEMNAMSPRWRTPIGRPFAFPPLVPHRVIERIIDAPRPYHSTACSRHALAISPLARAAAAISLG